MKNDLHVLIDAYRAKANDLIPRLSNALGFTLPITSIEWVRLHIPHRGQTGDGLQYFKHGIGVEIKYEGGKIDINFGDKGKYDGFDAWRLFTFAEANCIKVHYTSDIEIDEELKEAESKGEIRCSGSRLYYLYNDR